MKRRSTGCLRRDSVYSNKSTKSSDFSNTKVCSICFVVVFIYLFYSSASPSLPSPLFPPPQPPLKNTQVWRSPGYYEIPNVFGSDCFLKPEPLIEKTYTLRTINLQKHISKHPWRPAGNYT